MGQSAKVGLVDQLTVILFWLTVSQFKFFKLINKSEDTNEDAEVCVSTRFQQSALVFALADKGCALNPGKRHRVARKGDRS